MRIAVFSDSYFPQINGVVTQIENSIGALSKKGHEFVVVAPSQDAKFRKVEEEGKTILLLPSVALPTYKDYRIVYFLSRRLSRELALFRPELIHAHSPFSIGWLGLGYGKKLKLPVIGTYHTHIPEFLMYLPIPFIKKAGFAKRIAWSYAGLFYNRCSVVTTPTEKMKKELEENGIKNAVVLSNSIDFRLFSSFRKRKYSSKKIRLIYFGRIGFEKNIEVLIFALKRLLKNGKNISLTITGSGPALGHLKSIAQKEGVSQSIDFTGPKKGEALASHISGHDIFVTASTIETQGLAILEAMAVGLPCIGADCLAIPDSIREGKNGFLFKPFDYEGLSLKIERLADSASLRKRLGCNALKTAEKFSAEGISGTYEKLYATAIREFKRRKGRNN